MERLTLFRFTPIDPIPGILPVVVVASCEKEAWEIMARIHENHFAIVTPFDWTVKENEIFRGQWLPIKPAGKLDMKAAMNSLKKIDSKTK
jgi:hypothetical protein